MDASEKKGFLKGLDLYNNAYYWECHEALEHVWLESIPPLKLFLQGLIQAAASLYHVRNANHRGALKLAQASQDKLKEYLPAYEELPLTKIYKYMELVEKQAEAISNGSQKIFDLPPPPRLEQVNENVGISS